tara:strand:+ start:1655 stop:2086 length:432 start_codon:yes stop_codon:yes gene_type:complete
MKLLLACSLFFMSTAAFSDPSKPKVIKSENSKCHVKTTGGEYPLYSVYKGKRKIYSPQSDGIVTAIISPTGKYIALSGGEISLLDIKEGKFDYGVVIVNCETEKLKGYLKGKPTLIKSWWKDDKGLDIWEGLNLSGNSGKTLP